MALTPADKSQKFYELVWPRRADLLSMARLLTGNEAESEDLAQETLLKAFNAIETFRQGTDALAWLIRILRNARIDRIRSSARESANVSLDAHDIDVADSSPTEAPDAWSQEP